MTHPFAKYITSYKPKEFIIKEDDVDKDFYCLLQGSIGVWKGDVSDVSKLVKVGSIDAKGAYFGEMSYFLEEPRTASIIAETPSKVFSFSFSLSTAISNISKSS